MRWWMKAAMVLSLSIGISGAVMPQDLAAQPGKERREKRKDKRKDRKEKLKEARKDRKEAKKDLKEARKEERAERKEERKEKLKELKEKEERGELTEEEKAELQERRAKRKERKDKRKDKRKERKEKRKEARKAIKDNCKDSGKAKAAKRRLENERRKHFENIAKIDRLEELALDKDDKELLDKSKDLRKKEVSRHARKLGRIGKACANNPAEDAPTENQ